MIFLHTLFFLFLFCFSFLSNFFFNIPDQTDAVRVNATNQLTYEAIWSKREGVEAKFYISHPGTNLTVIHEKEKQGSMLSNGKELQTATFVVKVVSTNTGKMQLPVVDFSFMATNKLSGGFEAFNTNFVYSPILVKERKTSLNERLFLIITFAFLSLIFLSYLMWKVKNKIRVYKERKLVKMRDILWSDFIQELKFKESFQFHPDKTKYLLFILDKCEKFNKKAEELKCPLIPTEIISRLKNLENEIKFSPRVSSSKIDNNVAQFNKYVEERNQANVKRQAN